MREDAAAQEGKQLLRDEARGELLVRSRRGKEALELFAHAAMEQRVLRRGPSVLELLATSLPEGERELLLRRSLSLAPPVWDVALIDCPPSLGLITTNALCAASGLIIPVALDSASRTPLVRLIAAAQEVQSRLNEELELIGIIGTLHDKRRAHKADVLQWLSAQFDDDTASLEPGEYPIVFPTPIRNSTHVGESHGAQLPVTHYLRREKLTQSIAREDFEALAAEFLDRTQLGPPQSQVPSLEVANA